MNTPSGSGSGTNSASTPAVRSTISHSAAPSGPSSVDMIEVVDLDSPAAAAAAATLGEDDVIAVSGSSVQSSSWPPVAAAGGNGSGMQLNGAAATVLSESYSTNDPFAASTTASYSYATSPLTPTQSLSNILMAPGPSSSRYFSLATASPKLVQTTDNDLMNKLSSDESSSDSSSSESSAPTPPPNQPRIPSSTAPSSATALFELEPPPSSASVMAPSTSTNQNVSTDPGLQRHLFLSTTSISSDLTSPVLKRDRDHRVADMGGFMTLSHQPDVKSGGGSGTDHMVGGGSLKMMDDEHQGLLKVPCTSYSALSPTASYVTGGAACSVSTSSASQSMPFPGVDMLPKIFEAPVSALMSGSVASTPLPPDIDTLISTVAGSNTSPKFKQSHPQMPNDGVYVHLSTTPAPPPPPPPQSLPPGSLMDDVVNISASPGVKIIGTSGDQSAPVRLLPDLQQPPVRDPNHHQQVRILPNSRPLPSSDAVQLMPDGQVYDAGLSVSPLAVQDQVHQHHHAGQTLPGSASLSALPPSPNAAGKLVTPDAMQTQQQHPPPTQPPQAAVISRTIVVSGVEPIYVPAVGTASENKFVTSLMPPPVSLSVCATATSTSPVARSTRRAPIGKKQVLVSDLSLLEPLKPEPPLAPPALPAPPSPSGPQTVYLRPMFSSDSDGVLTAVHSPNAQRPVSVQPLPPPPQIQSSKTRKERQNLMKKVTSISCFKCQVCGFLGLTNKAVEDHMMLEHDADLEDGGDDSWLAVAQKEGIKLECSFCPNKFNAEGSRSFKVHVIDDHGVNEAEAEKQFRARYAERKATTLAFIKRKREEEREERRRCRKDGLEAYVDEHGELRVRSTRRGTKKRKGKKREELPDGGAGEDLPDTDNDKKAEGVDVSAKEYVAAIDVARKMEKAKKGGDEIKVRPDEKQKTLIEMTQRRRRKRLKKESIGDSDSTSDEGCGPVGEEVGGDIDIVNVPGASASATPARSPKKRAGRPRGARSIGLTRLRRMNPNIKLSDDHMGSECGVDGCGVRLRGKDNMEYHRRCHVGGGSGGKTLACPECPEAFSMWALLAQHLWRAHRVDMELHSCRLCTFKSYYLNTLNLHLQRHQTERPFLCDECGKRFKAEKSLKAHLRTACVGAGGGEGADASGSKGEASVKEEAPLQRCGVCQRDFKNVRRLRDHMASVHEKLKPFLCSSCPYSASNKSSLRLHLRLHTGEKPYKCDICNYRSGDHNTLRRHKMRHSGEKKYKCPYCSYSCIQATSYKIHIRRKHPPHAAEQVMFQCSKCVFRTVNQGNFLAHLVEHNDEGDGGGGDGKASKSEVEAQEADTTTDDGTGGGGNENGNASSSR